MRWCRGGASSGPQVRADVLLGCSSRFVPNGDKPWLSLECSLKIQPLTARLLGLTAAVHAAPSTLPESTQGCLSLKVNHSCVKALALWKASQLGIEWGWSPHVK